MSPDRYKRAMVHCEPPPPPARHVGHLPVPSHARHFVRQRPRKAASERGGLYHVVITPASVACLADPLPPLAWRPLPPPVTTPVRRTASDQSAPGTRPPATRPGSDRRPRYRDAAAEPKSLVMFHPAQGGGSHHRPAPGRRSRRACATTTATATQRRTTVEFWRRRTDGFADSPGPSGTSSHRRPRRAAPDHRHHIRALGRWLLKRANRSMRDGRTAGLTYDLSFVGDRRSLACIKARPDYQWLPIADGKLRVEGRFEGDPQIAVFRRKPTPAGESGGILPMWNGATTSIWCCATWNPRAGETGTSAPRSRHSASTVVSCRLADRAVDPFLGIAPSDRRVSRVVGSTTDTLPTSLRQRPRRLSTSVTRSQ